MLVPRTKSTRLVLPRGVAGSSDEPADADEGTLSYDTATGKMRIKTGAGWVDAGGGGGGGGVTTFNGRAGVVVPLAGDYTPALVGLGSVTNNVQWTSAVAGQISALSAKTTPVAADVLAGEDSAAGFAKKKFAFSDVRNYASTGLLPANMWTAPPPTAGSLDDEFQYGATAPFAGSPDFATRGWTVTNDAGTTMTRVGDVTLNYPSTLTSVQYLSTMTPGGLLVQSVSKMNVCKAVTGSWAFTADLRCNHQNTDSTYFYEAPMMWSVYPAKLDNTMSRVFIGNFGGNRYGSQMNVGQIYGTIIPTQSSNFPIQPWYAWLDWDSAGKNWRGLFADPVSDRIVSPNITTNNFAPLTMASAGFGLQTARAWSNSWVTVRHFRQYAQGKLPYVP